MQHEMKVSGITIDATSNAPIVILKAIHGDQALPIWIGILEATAIATELEQVRLSRPMTHDLFKNFMDMLKITISKVEVCDLRDNTFYAQIYFSFDNQSHHIDARPSDAIALALRMQAPIFVDESVMKRAAIHDRQMETDEKPAAIDRLEELNIQLNKAIKEERFEDAARLRDEILEVKKERETS